MRSTAKPTRREHLGLPGLSELCFLSSARITARGRQAPDLAAGLLGAGERGVGAHACAGGPHRP